MLGYCDSPHLYIIQMVLVVGSEKDGMQITVYNKQQITFMHLYFEGVMSWRPCQLTVW